MNADSGLLQILFLGAVVIGLGIFALWVEERQKSDEARQIEAARFRKPARPCFAGIAWAPRPNGRGIGWPVSPYHGLTHRLT